MTKSQTQTSERPAVRVQRLVSSIVWKAQFAWHARKLIRAPWWACWQMAAANLEDNLNGDTSECSAREMAEEERDAWLSCC